MKIQQLPLEVTFWAKVIFRTVLSRAEAKPRALLVCNKLCNGTFFSAQIVGGNRSEVSLFPLLSVSWGCPEG